jgi:DNA-directed RNA polymerase subunit L
VRVAAYVVPHPLESRMHIRIETVPEETPTNALRSALDRLTGSCDEFLEKFDAGLKSVKS